MPRRTVKKKLGHKGKLILVPDEAVQEMQRVGKLMGAMCRSLAQPRAVSEDDRAKLDELAQHWDVIEKRLAEYQRS